MRYTLCFRGVPFGQLTLPPDAPDPAAVAVTALSAASVLVAPTEAARAGWRRADARLRAEIFDVTPAARQRRRAWGAAARLAGPAPTPAAWAVARALAPEVELRDEAGRVLATAHVDLVLAPGGGTPRAAVVHRDPLAAPSGAARAHPVRSAGEAASVPPAA